ncbi:hypothetical protein P873_11975 [Arenimonas composti TR7-09 = DSM 18010]|uniref:Uncharacterized protein n=2 Tax=Arenimonas TaxID=490567 RepID=A0A091BBN8_9GAMM|nr:hypothetical protein P873_11975 [Arenimonas composti TR7-09 = DSM 18010]
MRSAGGPRWPAGRRLLGAMVVGLVSLPLMGLNGWFGIGVMLALVLGLLWGFDFAAELRASPPGGRWGPWAVRLAAAPKALFGLISLGIGVAIVAWLLWNLFVARQPEFQWTSLYGLFVPLGLIVLGQRWLAEAVGRKPAVSNPEAAWQLRHDAAGVTVQDAEGSVRTLVWDEVEVVAIETNDSGPWGADVWFVLTGERGDVAWPMGADGEAGMLEVLRSRFPGFDDEAVIAAMRSTENARFICWTRRTG